MFNVNFNIWGNKDENKIVASIPSTQGADGDLILNSPVSIPSNQPIRSIDNNQKTYVISHGFTNTGGNQGNNYTASLSEIAKALRSQPENANANIILVDWEEGAKAQGVRQYVIPAQNTREVGNQIAQFLNKQDIDPNKTELIGHSLGAQVSGFAGAKYKELTGQEIDQITGLDPAAFGIIVPLDSFDRQLTWKTRFTQPVLNSVPLPVVESAPPSDRLDPDDAKRVVVLHSSNVLGTDELLGDLDFFVNQDIFIKQPGISPIGIVTGDNHSYANELYTQLIKGNVFPQSDGSNFDYSRLKSSETGRIDVDTTKVLFEGSTSGTFDNGENKKILGTPCGGDSESYVRFDGRRSDGNEFSNDQEFSQAKGISTASDIPFSLGNLTYRNGSTVFGSEPEGDFPLDVTLSLTNPVPSAQTFNFSLNLTTTKNTNDDPFEDGDILRFSDSGISQQIIKFPGSTGVSGYRLELVGFSTDDGKTTVGRFNTPEQRLSDALLIGKIKPVSILIEAAEGTTEAIITLPGKIGNKIGKTLDDFNGKVANFSQGLLDGLSASVASVLSPSLRVAQNLQASAEQNSTFQISETVLAQYPGGMLGTEDNDRIIGSSVTDVVLAVSGADTLEGAAGGDYLLGGKGDDRILGEDGNDLLTGNEGNDFVSGGVGDDLLRGGKGNDEIFGDDGEDILIGETGIDRLTGGGGSDIFILRTDTGTEETNPATADWLIDFNASDGDIIGINGGVPIDILAFTPADVNQDGIADTIIKYTETSQFFGVYTNVFGVVINTPPDIVKSSSFPIPMNDPITQIGML